MSASTEKDGFPDCEDENKMNQLEETDLKNMLEIQLEEVNMLQSMFSIPGEFEMHDPSIIIDVQDFISGKSNVPPRHLDFTVNLMVEDEKLVINVNIPSNYPFEEAEVYVRNDSLTRAQQHDLNSDLSKFTRSLFKGDIRICQGVSWLQENALSYFVNKKKEYKPKPRSEPIKTFSRHWIYTHHISTKKPCVMEMALEHNVTGFCLAGKPGIICIEGLKSDCSECVKRIRGLKWMKIKCTRKEEMPIPKNSSIESFQKFTIFQELVFETGKYKSNEKHVDMGQFYKYLVAHDCAYAFKDLFGIQGKLSPAENVFECKQ